MAASTLGSSPSAWCGHDSGAKFLKFFKASFAGGDIRVIKSRKGEAKRPHQNARFFPTLVVPAKRKREPGPQKATVSICAIPDKGRANESLLGDSSLII